MYNLKIDQKQARLLSEALDVYSRILMGQLEIVEEQWRWKIPYSDGKMQRMEEFRQRLYDAKKVLGMPANGHPGIHSSEISDDARKAYDMQQVIRYIDSWNRSGKDPNKDTRDFSSMMGVNYDEPRKTSVDPDFNLPTMEVSNEK